MTRADVRTLALAHTQIEAPNYLAGDTAGQNALIQRVLDDLSRRSRKFYAEGVTLTLVSGTATYNPLSFAKRIFDVRAVILNGNALGMRNAGDASEWPEGYLARTGQPEDWWMVAGTPNLLHLAPIPNSISPVVTVNGFYLHPTVADDAQVLEFPDDDLKTVAKAVAADMLEPYRNGSSMEHWTQLMGEVEQKVQEWQALSRNRAGGRRVKGGADSYGWARIG
jgi:hypothetical protein